MAKRQPLKTPSNLPSTSPTPIVLEGNTLDEVRRIVAVQQRTSEFADLFAALRAIVNHHLVKYLEAETKVDLENTVYRLDDVNGYLIPDSKKESAV